MPKPLKFLLLANYQKGFPFIEECRRIGVSTVVITNIKLREKERDWPDCIEEIFYVEDLANVEALVDAVSYLARSRDFDAIVPLDDYAVETAAALREHTRTPGMGVSTSRYFRDKLAMRMQAREAGLKVPDFVHVLNHDKIDGYLNSVPSPWLIKPRSEAGSVQIKKFHQSHDMWNWINHLGDRQSRHLIEAFVPGEVFHVDSVVFDGKVMFAAPHRYWRPPFDVWNGGGIFMSQSVPSFDKLYKPLLKANRGAIKAMGLPYGVTHVEFIRSNETGDIHFLELAARVGGAYIDIMVEGQSGKNLWREWARVEAAQLRGEKYEVAPTRALHGGVLLCLSRQAEEDMSNYSDPEVYWSLNHDYHAGVVIASDNYDRVTELMEKYKEGFERDILAVAPPTEKPA